MGIVLQISKMKSCVFLFSLGIILVALLQDTYGIPSPRKVIDLDGDTYNEDDCEDSAKDAERSGACAVIFEQQECDLSIIGDKLEIKEGVWTNLRGTGFHEDVESIIVKPGCVVFGYDENDKKERGTGISVSGVGKTDWVYKELNDKFDLEDDIEAVECFCGQKAIQATQVLPLKADNFLEAIPNWLKLGTATNYCNLFIHAFNRLPVTERPCAILFESEDCSTSDGIFLKDWYLEILPDNKIINLPEISTGAKADSAEAVLIRPGCTFSAYDEDDGLGKEITVKAPGNSKRPKFYPLASKYNPFKSGLKEDIDSYRCTCN